PQVLLPEGRRRVLGVRTDRADGYKLGDAGQPRLLHELQPHDGVVVEESAGVPPVAADAADHSGQVDDDIGPGISEQPPDRIPLAQVVIGDAGNDNGAGLKVQQPATDRLAEKAGATGDHYAKTTQKTHQRTSLVLFPHPRGCGNSSTSPGINNG